MITEEWEKRSGCCAKKMLDKTGIVCGHRNTGRKDKRSPWWDVEIRVSEKKRLYEVDLQCVTENDRLAYKEKNRKVKKSRSRLDESGIGK